MSECLSKSKKVTIFDCRIQGTYFSERGEELFLERPGFVVFWLNMYSIIVFSAQINSMVV